MDQKKLMSQLTHSRNIYLISKSILGYISHVSYYDFIWIMLNFNENEYIIINFSPNILTNDLGID